jgi:drug/metabolite transporter (DMT)-like permease
MHWAQTGKEPSPLLVVAAFAAVYTIWGSTYIAIAIAIESTPPFMMAALRFFAAGLILYLWCIARGERTPDLKSVSKNAFAGVLMLFFGTTSLIWVEQYLPAGLCSIVIAGTPFWFVLLDRKHWRVNFSDKFIIAGLLIGLTGIVMLYSGHDVLDLGGNRIQTIGFFVLVASAIMWAIGSLYSKYAATKGSTAIKAGIQLMAAGVFSFVVSLLSGEYSHFSWNQVTMNSVSAMLYLITFGSFIGFIAYSWLLQVRPPAIVGTYAYVNPAVALFLGWWMLGEKITTGQIASLFIILSGVLLVNLSKYFKEFVLKPFTWRNR